VRHASLQFDGPTLDVARALGLTAQQMAAEAAERQLGGFVERSQAFVLRYLRSGVRASGEDIVDAAKEAGIRPREDRAFGAVFGGLSRAGRIRCVGIEMRRKGRGTAGARVWEAA
jgi:hypothetical protein